jgi:hypothetical protein
VRHYGDRGDNAGFTSFRAGDGFLNLIAQPAERHWSWWGGRSSTDGHEISFAWPLKR